MQFYDATSDKANILNLKAGVNPGDVVLRQVNDSGTTTGNGALEISISGTSDKIAINGFFYGNNPDNINNPVQQLHFDNGDTWDLNAIVAHLVG